MFDKIASHYELETVEHFVSVFAEIDIDQGGTIDQEEIYDALQEAGVEISEEGVETLFNMIDEDGSGEIDQDEWKEAVNFYLELKEEEAEASIKVVVTIVVRRVTSLLTASRNLKIPINVLPTGSPR